MSEIAKACCDMIGNIMFCWFGINAMRIMAGVGLIAAQKVTFEQVSSLFLGKKKGF